MCMPLSSGYLIPANIIGTPEAPRSASSGQKPRGRWFTLRLNLLASILLLTTMADGGQADHLTQNPTASGFQATLTESERTWLRDHPVIRVVQDPGWPPVEFTDERGELSGMAGDYLRLIEQRLGVKFERVQNLTWQEAYDRLKRWEIDLTTSVAVTPERAEFWTFTKPYMTIPIVIATLPEVTYIADLRELAGKKVGVVDGYAVNDWIPRDFPGIQLVRYKTAQEGLEALQRGEVFAYIDNLLVIGHYQARMKITNIKIAGETPYDNAQAMAVRKDWAPLAGILQKALDSISETERNDIYRKWLPLRYEHGFNYTLFWEVLAAFTLILAGLMVWNRKLSREIGRRKTAEATLRENEASFRSLLEAAPEGIFVQHGGRFVYLNPAMRNLLGATKGEDLLGTEFMARMAPEWREIIRERIQQQRATLKPAPLMDQEYLRLDGARVPVETTAVPLRFQGSDAHLVFVRDITTRKRMEMALREREENLAVLFEDAPVGYHEVDTRGCIVRVNRTELAMLGYTAEEMLGRPVWEFVVEQEESRTAVMERLMGKTPTADLVERHYRRKDGSSFPAQIENRIQHDAKGQVAGIRSTLQDITARRKHKQEIERLNRLYAALSQINQAIVRSPTREALLAEVCRVLHHFGKFKMVWLGRPDQETRRVLPIAQSGDDRGYLKEVCISTEDCPEGRGPTGLALREGRTYVCNDSVADPITKPWQEAMIRHGLVASIALPIRQSGAVCGVLTVYAAEKGYFGEPEIALLEETATDISFALDNLVHETQRRQAEEQLYRLNRELLAISECNQALVRAVDEQTLLNEVCQIVCEKAGYCMAWVGYAEHDEDQSVRPVAWGGLEEDYLVSANITWADVERGRGPVGTAIRSGKTCYIQDFTSSALSVPWHKPALARGYRSVIALPLLDEQGSALGALTIYAGQPNAFSPEEIKLLEELSADLAFGVLALRTRAARQKVEEQLKITMERLDHAVRSADMGQWRWEIPENRRYFDDRVCQLLGLDPAAFKGTAEEFYAVVHPQDRDRLKANLTRTLAQGVAYELEYRVIWPDGSVHHIATRGRLARNAAGQPERINGLLWDITALKQTENNLRQALERAEAASRAKDTFLANMSHELRTPLNGILGMTELLLGSTLDAEQKDCAETVYRAGEGLLNIVSDVLDLSQIEAGRVHLESITFELAQVINDVVALFGTKMASGQVEIAGWTDPELNGILTGDPARLRQILINLVSNAVKFTNQGFISISAHCLAVVDHRASFLLAVQDSGEGIPPEYLPSLYERFSQADMTYTRSRGGTGLGLANVKRLVDLMGGTIEVISTPGRGTTFVIDLTLPINQEGLLVEAAPSSSGLVLPATGGVGRVLLVEDNPLNQKTAKQMLVKMGILVTTADDGQDALAAMEKEEYDLVLMDVQMPNMDGFESTRAIRTMERGTGRHLPIIAMTAFVMKGDRERCLAAGMDDFLGKPVKFDALQDALSRWQGSHLTSPTRGKERSAFIPTRTTLPEMTFNLKRLQQLKTLFPASPHEYLDKALRPFVSSLEAQLTQLAELARKEEWERLAEAAHRLQGMADNVGAAHLATLAKQLVSQALLSGAEEVKRLLADMQQEAVKIKTDIVRMGSSIPRESGPA